MHSNFEEDHARKRALIFYRHNKINYQNALDNVNLDFATYGETLSFIKIHINKKLAQPGLSAEKRFQYQLELKYLGVLLQENQDMQTASQEQLRYFSIEDLIAQEQRYKIQLIFADKKGSDLVAANLKKIQIDIQRKIEKCDNNLFDDSYFKTVRQKYYSQALLESVAELLAVFDHYNKAVTLQSSRLEKLSSSIGELRANFGPLFDKAKDELAKRAQFLSKQLYLTHDQPSEKTAILRDIEKINKLIKTLDRKKSNLAKEDANMKNLLGNANQVRPR